MLRDPVSRSISQYWAFRFPRLRDPAQAPEDFEDYVETLEGSRLDNIQTRFVSGTVDRESVGHRELEAAKHNLRTHFSAVGITERFRESLALYARTFRWRAIPLVRQNETPRSEAHRRFVLSNSQRERLTVANRIDTELYEFARGLLDEQLVRHGLTAADVNRLVHRGPWTDRRVLADRVLRKFYFHTFGVASL